MSNATIVQTLKKFVTGQEMRDAMEFTYGTGMSGTTEYDAIQYLWNGKYYILFVSAIYGTSWNNLNSANLVKGKIITLKEKKYKVRLMKGSEEDVVIDESKILTSNTEYYQFVKMRKEDISLLSNSSLITSSSYYLIMQELMNNTNNCLYCKFTSSSSTNNATVSGSFSNSISDSNYHAVFILEELTPLIGIETADLGDIIGDDDNTINYTVTNPSGGNVHTVIQINDNIIGSVDIPSGVRSEYIITTEQIKDLPYGKHEITFLPSCVIGGETIVGEKKGVSFTKVKKLNPPLINANLGKLVNQINLVSEDMDYQLLRLNQELSNMGITVNGTSSLANIVKYLRDNGVQIKKWASGQGVGNKELEVRGLGFKPTLVLQRSISGDNFYIHSSEYMESHVQYSFSYAGGSKSGGFIMYDDGFKFGTGLNACYWIAYE